MTESAYLERDARGIVVRRFMVECRTEAPEVYRRAFALHYARLGWRHDLDTCTASLESSVRVHPGHAQVVIDAMEMANCDGAKHENLIGILHAMRARVAARQLLDDMDCEM